MTPTDQALRLFVDQVETPVGPFTLIADARGRLHAAGWTDDSTDGRMAAPPARARARPESALVRATDPGGLSTALAAYFAGDLAAIDGLPLADAIGTPFQRAVWGAAARDPVRRDPVLRRAGARHRPTVGGSRRRSRQRRRIRSASSSPVIGSSARPARWSATAAVSNASAGCSRTRRAWRRERASPRRACPALAARRPLTLALSPQTGRGDRKD